MRPTLERVTDRPVKPLLRGRLHQGAFFASIPAGAVLVALGSSATERLAAAVFAGSLAGLFGTSAAYHLIARTPRAIRWMQRLDHSMIYLLIAGSYTAFGLLVLEGAWRAWILAVVWTGFGAGVVVKLFGLERLRVLGGVLYIALGWTAIVAMPHIVRRASRPVVALLVLGGVLYTAGATVLWRRRPNPSPAVFGYHEVWHTFVIAAGACHYAAVLALVAGA